MEIIPSLKADIKSGRNVLFTGAPCQVAAIRNIYTKKPDNLFLVDIIYHGAPSLKSLQEHIEHVSPNDHYDTVIFRDGYYIVVGGKEKRCIGNIYLKNVLKMYILMHSLMVLHIVTVAISVIMHVMTVFQILL